jgi:hypothetical protein
MPQQSPSLSWIVGLFILIVIVGVLLGSTLSRTDFFNFNTSAAEMRARDQATTAQAQRDAVNQLAYQAKVEVDQQVYRMQQAALAEKQIADAQRYKTQQQTQAEVERQRQLADIEIQREQRLADIRAQEQSQAQLRAEQAARAAEELKWTSLFKSILAIAFIATVGTVLAGSLVGIMVVAWSQLKRIHGKLSTQQANTQIQVNQPVVAESATSPLNAAPAETADHKFWQDMRRQARANEVALRYMQLHPELVPDTRPVKYEDLPLAVMKDDPANDGSDHQGRASKS